MGCESFLGVAWLAVGAALVGCSNDCDDEIVAASRFLENPANRTCQVDDDCVVVDTECADVPGANCGQAQVNRAASESSQWHTISRGLSTCDRPEGCAECFAQLTPQCIDGFCGGSP